MRMVQAAQGRETPLVQMVLGTTLGQGTSLAGVSAVKLSELRGDIVEQ